MISTKLANQIVVALKVLIPSAKGFDRNGDRHECKSDGFSQVEVNSLIETEITSQVIQSDDSL